MERDLQEILRAGLRSVDPEAVIRRGVRLRNDRLEVAGKRLELQSLDRIVIIGFGKASTAMARGMDGVMSGLTSRGVSVQGLLITKHGHNRFKELKEGTGPFTVLEAGHPLPDRDGVDATRLLLDLAQTTGEKDLVICLVSGGGSALLCHPQPGITLEDKIETTGALLSCGASIHEMNALRKHLSRVKGGRLAEALSPSRIISLVLSDVVGDDLSVIASGPTCPDDSTFEDVDRILKKYQIRDRLPRSVRGYLDQGLRGEVPETLKRDHPVFSSVTHRVVGNNLLACRACEVKARDLGYHTLVLSDSIQGEARECAVFHAGIVQSISGHDIPVEKPACVISGGENTVTVTGTGMGGRNQEFCLAMIPWIAGLRDVAVLSAGTDGNDGPTDAAGAIVTGQSLDRSKTVGLDVDRSLRNNDSYHFLEQIGALLKTGPTNTNVMDLRILLVR